MTAKPRTSDEEDENADKNTTREGDMAKLTEEIAAYETMRRELEIDHFGEWALVHDGELIGTYETFEEAAEVAVPQFGRGPYLIREIGEGPLRLPARWNIAYAGG